MTDPREASSEPPPVPRAAPPAPDPSGVREPAGAPSRWRLLTRRLWWVHSAWGLLWGAGVMTFARAGLAYADKVLVALLLVWLVMFVALRFVVGPANRRPNETLARQGVRLVTNYVVKQFYQQMFFFLTPLYASSATWSLAAANWWLAPVLFACAVVSTLDLVFDNYIMERRHIVAAMYGLAMFAVLNVMLPLVAGLSHRGGLILAAAATPASVAFLSFSVRRVTSPRGALLVVAATGALVTAVWLGRVLIPPAPLAMLETTVGHGTIGSYECLPGSKHQIRANQLDGLRCGSMMRDPGGLKEDVVHVWSRRGVEIARVPPERMQCDDGNSIVFRSFLPPDQLPADPTGRWTCKTMTVGGQLVGIRKFEIVTPEGKRVREPPDDEAHDAGDAGVPDAGAPDDAPAD